MAGYTLHEAQLGIVNGERQPVNKQVTVVTPKNPFGPEGRKGPLIVAVEMVTKEHQDERICNLVASTIHRTYFADRSLSITSSLREALRVANRVLYKYYLQLPESQRMAVGVTCLALKGWDLFIAQVVPSHLAVISNGQVHLYPTSPSAVGNTHHDAAYLHGLGRTLSVEPELYRRLLEPHDTLVWYSSTIAAVLRRRHLETIGEVKSAAEVIEWLARHCRDASITTGYAFAARLEPLAHPLPASRPEVGGRRGWSLKALLMPFWSRLPAIVGKPYTTRPADSQVVFDERTTVGPAADHVHPSVLEAATRMPEQPNIPLSPFPRPQPLDWKQPREGNEPPARHHRVNRATASASKPIVLSHVPAHAPPLRPRFQRRPLSSMRRTERIIYLLQWFWYWLTHRFVSNHPRRWPLVARRSERHHEQPQIRWLVFLVLVLSLTSLILYGVNLSHRSAEQHDMDYLDRASQELAALAQASSPTAALEHLERAGHILDLVRASPLVTYSNSVLWLRYEDIRRSYEQGLAQVKLQTFLEQPVVLATHPRHHGRFSSLVVPPAATAADAAEPSDPRNSLYALDSSKSNSAVYRIPREGGVPEPLLVSQQAIRGTPIGTISAIAWRIDNLVAVGEHPEVKGFGYYFLDNGTWNYTRLGASELWHLRGRLDMEAYQGNLYFWGAEFGEIIKFSSGHYGDTPQLWLSLTTIEAIDITTAVDMAVDGKIYLLIPNGQVLVFNMGQYERTISPPPLIPPLASVTRFVLTGPPESGHIFLLDTLNERIIQMDKTSGALIQQITVHPDAPLRPSQLTDLAVDTSRNPSLLYLVNGRQIIRGNIPTPPRPLVP